MNKLKEIVLIDEYYHIDNGGIKVKLTATNNGDDVFNLTNLSFSNSFYGYTSNEMCIHKLITKYGVNIVEDLGKKLINAAEECRKLNKESK